MVLEFTQYVLSSLIAFVGIILGVLIARMAEDELPQFKHAIPYLQHMGLLVIFAVLYYFFPFGVVTSLLVVTFFFMYMFWNKRENNFLEYVVLAMLFVISSVNTEAHLYVTSLLFIFGISSGMLFYALHRKPKEHVGTKDKLQLHYFKHSGKHLSIRDLFSTLVKQHYFFLVLIILTYVIGNAITFFY